MQELNVLSTGETIKELHKRLNSDKPFTFVRYGDGELLHMDGWGGYDGNHKGCNQLREELAEGFKIDDPDYLIAIQTDYQDEPYMEKGLFKHSLNNSMRAICQENFPERKNYYNGVAICYTALFNPEIFKPFWDDILKKRILLVCGEHLTPIAKMIKAEQVVFTPKTQAYYSITNWYRQVVKNIPRTDVVLFALGVATNVVQKRLWLENHKTISLDIGALFDAMLGLESREWIRRTKGRHDVFKQYLKEEKNG